MPRLAAFLVLLVAVAPLRAQDAKERDFRPLIEKHKGDFDYLLGDWTFTARNGEFGEFHGVWSAVRLATGGGAHVLDEYRVTGDSGETYFVSSTLRVYDPTKDQWSLVSVHETSGLGDVGTGRKVGEEMHLEQVFGAATGKPERWRIRYHDIRSNSFSWVADRSMDGGATWEKAYMTLEATRVGPARALDALATPRRISRRQPGHEE